MPLIHALLPRSSLGCARGSGSPSLAEAPHFLLITATEKPAAPPSHPGMGCGKSMEEPQGRTMQLNCKWGFLGDEGSNGGAGNVKPLGNTQSSCEDLAR